MHPIVRVHKSRPVRLSASTSSGDWLQSFGLTLRTGSLCAGACSILAHHQVQNPRIALLGGACHWPDPNPKPLRKVSRCAK
jgi:hypothetical protein